MPANTSPIFTLTPQIGMVQVSTANTNRDGSGTLGTLITGATNGTRIRRIDCKATGTTTAGMLRFYMHDGTNTRLWFEIAVSAVTPSASVPAWSDSRVFADPPVLPSGWSIKVSTHNAETFNVISTPAGDY